MERDDRFLAIFEQLKGILKPFEPSLIVQADDSANYSLNTAYVPQYKKELFFGAVQIKKNYVSYYLMPVYMFPDLLDEISPQLRKRMQGKSCFNFATVDRAMVDELAQLTARGFDRFRQESFV